MDIMAVSYMKQISKSVCNRKQSRKALKRLPICLTGSDHYFILFEIKRGDTIVYERDMSIYNNDQ